MSIVLLLMAAGTEPGIIPRHVDVLMESIPPAYREMAEKQENRRRFQINKKQLIENQKKAMAKKNQVMHEGGHEIEVEEVESPPKIEKQNSE